MRRLTTIHISWFDLSGRARVVAVLLLLFVIAFGVAQRVSAASGDDVPSDKHVITIYDQGEKRVVLTDAGTVRETLDQAGASLSEHDRVEPTLDTEFVAQNYIINIYRARPVMIVDGMKREQVLTPYGAAKDIVKDAGIEVHDEDILSLEQSSDVLRDGVGSKLTIERAISVQLVLYGVKSTAYTQATTVEEFLEDKKIELGDDDTLSVAKDTAISEGMTLEIWRNGVQTVAEEQEVDFPVEQIKDADREAGYREVQTPGKKGKKSVTYEVTMKNGQEVARKEIQSVMTSEPEKQVEIIGAKSSFDGDFASALAKLRACEAGGNYANKRNPTYRGAYQFGYGTWANYGGYTDPADAPPEVQDQAARDLYVRRGWQPWPHCGASLPDTFR